MRTHARRISMAAVLLLAGGSLLAGPGTGCFSYLADSAITTADMCFIFDCTNGILGGTVQPCDPAGGIFGDDQSVLFTDCPPP